MSLSLIGLTKNELRMTHLMNSKYWCRITARVINAFSKQRHGDGPFSAVVLISNRDKGRNFRPLPYANTISDSSRAVVIGKNFMVARKADITEQQRKEIYKVGCC